MLFIKKANIEDAEKEYLFVRDIPEDENGFINDYHGISGEKFKTEALSEMINFSNGIGLPEGFVPESFYFFWEDDTIIGQLRIRHHLCESLINGSGHIGYYIAPEYRGRGYGTKLMALAIKKASKIVPEEEIYLRVNRDNPASLRCMLKNGGYIHHEDDDHYYVRVKKYEHKD